MGYQENPTTPTGRGKAPKKGKVIVYGQFNKMAKRRVWENEPGGVPNEGMKEYKGETVGMVVTSLQKGNQTSEPFTPLGNERGGRKKEVGKRRGGGKPGKRGGARGEKEGANSGDRTGGSILGRGGKKGKKKKMKINKIRTKGGNNKMSWGTHFGVKLWREVRRTGGNGKRKFPRGGKFKKKKGKPGKKDEAREYKLIGGGIWGGIKGTKAEKTVFGWGGQKNK